MTTVENLRGRSVIDDILISKLAPTQRVFRELRIRVNSVPLGFKRKNPPERALEREEGEFLEALHAQSPPDPTALGWKLCVGAHVYIVLDKEWKEVRVTVQGQRSHNEHNI